MNIFQKIYYRSFQTVFRVALPFLPYRDPKIVEKLTDVPAVLKAEGKVRPLIVTDRNVRGAGLTKDPESALEKEGIDFSVFDGVVANPTPVLWDKERLKAAYRAVGGEV